MRGRDHNLLSGPLAIVLTIVGIAIQSNEPGTKASGAEIASYFTDHKTQVTVSTILFGISAALLVLFGARLRERWREQTPEHRTLSLVVFGGGVATAAGLAFGCAVTYTLVDVAPHASPQTLQALNALITGSPLYFTIGLAIMVAGCQPSRSPRASSLLGSDGSAACSRSASWSRAVPPRCR